MNKYGIENFTFTLVKACKPQYLNRFEKLYIRIYQTTNDNYGYNKTIGGDNVNIRQNKVGVRFVSRFIDKRYKQGFRYRYANPNGQHLYSYDLIKLLNANMKGFVFFHPMKQ